MQKVAPLAVILLFTMLIGCDIFETREAEEPIISGNNEEFPASPEILMQNFSKAILAKNSQNYISCFTDSAFASPFRFTPANSSVNIYPSLAGSWDLKAERRYFDNMLLQINTEKSMEFTLRDEKLTRYSDSAHYSAHYIIAVTLKKTDDIQRYEGDMHLSMQLDTRSRWAIRSWTDVNSAQNICWSDLKGFFY